MGTAARRSARSNARPKSRWLGSGPATLAYLIRSHCTGGGAARVGCEASAARVETATDLSHPS